MRTYKGWTIIRPDHNSPWWDAERPSGRLAGNGESIPEGMGAPTWRQLRRMIDERAGR